MQQKGTRKRPRKSNVAPHSLDTFCTGGGDLRREIEEAPQFGQLRTMLRCLTTKRIGGPNWRAFCERKMRDASVRPSTAPGYSQTCPPDSVGSLAPSQPLMPDDMT